MLNRLQAKDVSFEELGGAQTHAVKSGVASKAFATEEDCFEQVKLLLSFLPSNNLETAPIYDCEDDLNQTF